MPNIIPGIQVRKKYLKFLSKKTFFSFLLFITIRLIKLTTIDKGNKILIAFTRSMFKIINVGVPITNIPTPAILCIIVKKKITK